MIIYTSNPRFRSNYNIVIIIIINYLRISSFYENNQSVLIIILLQYNSFCDNDNLNKNLTGIIILCIQAFVDHQVENHCSKITRFPETYFILYNNILFYPMPCGASYFFSRKLSQKKDTKLCFDKSLGRRRDTEVCFLSRIARCYFTSNNFTSSRISLYS